MFSTFQIQRSLSTAVIRMIRQPSSRRNNPGMAHQLRNLEGDPEDFTEEADGIESDFMEVHKTHREMESELMRQRERVRHFMIKHKYFRDVQLPNMLTYAEKEQMRLLHERDPDEWTVERLAESFPATTDVVAKILKAKWKMRSVQRIRQHDEKVIQNWEQLRNGKLNTILPPELLQHLRSFAMRTREDLQALPADEFVQNELPKPKGDEFLSIITTCRKYADRTDETPMKPEPTLLIGADQTKNQFKAHENPEDETYLLDKVKDKRKMRLQELKQLKLTPAERETLSSTSESNIEKHAAESLQNPAGTGVLSRKENENKNLMPAKDFGFMEKFESNEIVISTEDQKRFEITRVKDRIHIPRKVWKKGGTYRVEDCYYDDDGEFLYRVPGMTGQA